MMGGETWADSRNPKARIMRATVVPKNKKKNMFYIREELTTFFQSRLGLARHLSEKKKKHLDISSLD